MENNINISFYSKIKVYWDDRPENYNKEAKTRIKNHFAKKYGVKKDNIEVIYRPVKLTENGDVIQVDGASIENIMDVTYQRELMKEWLKRENKVIDFNRVISLDDKINAELNIDNDDIRQSHWAIKWIRVNNFLSFGEDNYVPFNKLKGLTVVNSTPSNQGGKTTLTIDSIKFLLHGNTTKTDKNEEIFNQFSDKNELTVRGMIEMNGEELIIERKMKRSAKKGGGWSITNKVNYYELLPDGEEKAQNEEDAIRTTAKLKATVGTEKEFEMLVLATEKNLDDLIGLTTTESGKILTRLIGLEVIEKKEGKVRDMYNEFNRKKKSNDYDIITLNDEISSHKEKIELSNGIELTLTQKLSDTNLDIDNLNNENDRLLSSKVSIDVTILTLNPSKLEEEIQTITNDGKSLKVKIANLNGEINKIGMVDYDEDEYFRLNKENNNIIISIGNKSAEINRLKVVIDDLINSGICSSCNRKLDNVDNTKHIEEHNRLIAILTSEVEGLTKQRGDINGELTKLAEVKEIVTKKNKLELERDRAEVEIGSLRNKLQSKANDLDKYKLNQESIELNRSIDAEVSNVKTKLSVANFSKDTVIKNIEKIKAEIIMHNTEIQNKKKLIEQINKEAEIEKIFKIYIDLVGKKGISKLVLRSVLPIINAEVSRLLEDVCDFEIEIFIDDKNDVQFLLNKDGVSKLLKSGSGFERTAASLALRAVLGKISILPMPNFITFDEVLGKIAPENIEKLKTLFDKIKDMYEIVFLITHNDIIKDWSTNNITVIKTNNISNVTIS